MKIKVKKLGILEQAEFELGDLTIICGENNSGKTYATYALYGFLVNWRKYLSFNIADKYIEDLFEKGTVDISLGNFIKDAKNVLKRGCDKYQNQISDIFATNKDRFKDCSIEIEINVDIKKEFSRTLRSKNLELFTINKKNTDGFISVTLIIDKKQTDNLPPEAYKRAISDSIVSIVYGNSFPETFIASAERTGAAIFRKELNFARNRLLEEIGSAGKDKKISPLRLIQKDYQDYALPVKANVDFTRQLESVSKNSSYISEKHRDIVEKFSDIIGGEYLVTKQDELLFKPKGKGVKLTMDESSSAVRSLLDIGFYIKHVAKKGDLLMVDEPELNLHPKNQRRVARLFAKLVNVGVKIFVTTHSDYFIKELNTLIMLKNDLPHLKEIAEKEGYSQDEMLNADQIRVYIAGEDKILRDNASRKGNYPTLKKADINQKQGIEVKSFDDTIDEMNRIQEAIVWGGDND